MSDLREDLKSATQRYRETEAAHEHSQKDVLSAILAALRGGVTPTEVERLSPFTAAYIRRVARAEGVPPAAPGPKRAGS